LLGILLVFEATWLGNFRLNYSINALLAGELQLQNTADTKCQSEP